MNEKTYLLFEGDNYSPGGGWNDFKGAFETLEAARNGVSRHIDWWQIVDGRDYTLVEEGPPPPPPTPRRPRYSSPTGDYGAPVEGELPNS